MADGNSDNVKIVGIDKGIPAWATEKTLKDLKKKLDDLKKQEKSSDDKLKSLNNLFSTFSKQYKKDSDRQEKIQKPSGKSGGVSAGEAALLAELKSLRRSVDSDRASSGGGGSSGSKGSKGKSGIAALDDSLKSKDPTNILVGKATNNIANLIEPTTKLGQATKSVAGAFGKLEAGIVGTAVAIVEFFTEQFTAVNKQYTAIYSQGIKLGKESIGTQDTFTNSVIASGLSLDQFSKNVAKHGSIVNLVGGKSYAKSLSSMVSSGSKFGLTLEESSEFMSEYLEGQKSRGTIESETSARTRSAANYALKETMDFARALGISRDEIDATRKKQKDDVSIQAAMQGIPEELRDKVGRQLTEMSATFGKLAPGADKALEAMFKYGPAAAAISDEAKQMMTANAPMYNMLQQQVQSMKSGNLADGVGSTVESLQQLVDSTTGMESQLLARSKTGDMAAMNQLAAYNQAKVMLQNFKQFGKLSGKEDPAARIRADLEVSMNKIKNAFSIAFGKIFNNPALMKAITEFANKLAVMAPKISEAIQKLALYLPPVIEKFVNWLNSLFDKQGNLDVGKLMTDMITNPFVMAYAALKLLGPALGRMLLSGMTTLIGGMLSSIGGFLSASVATIGAGATAALAGVFIALGAMLLDSVYELGKGLFKTFDSLYENWGKMNWTERIGTVFMGIVGSVGRMLVKVFTDILKVIMYPIQKAANLLGFKDLGKDTLDSMSSFGDKILDSSLSWASNGKTESSRSESPEKNNKDKPPVEKTPSRTTTDKQTPAEKSQQTDSQEEESPDVKQSITNAQNAINSGDTGKALSALVDLNQQMLDTLEKIRLNTKYQKDHYA